jgi:hypothetical protein
MSPPHPNAIGSYGASVIAHAAIRGIELRYWQRLALTRLLEHDEAGKLVWFDCLISTARQVGKSYALRELALWRMVSEDILGGEQLVLHTGKDLAVCREIQRRARPWAREQGWTVRETNAQEEIRSPSESRWLIRAQSSVYGYTSTLALLDEAWAVEATIIEDGIEPTLVEIESGQLVMFSTAHRRCTALVPVRRAALLAGLAHPPDVPTSLIVEWSAPRNAELDDRAAWRAASPHWSPARERLLEAKLARVGAGQSIDPDEDDPEASFRSQFLNVWPRRRIVSSAVPEPLIDGEAWANLADLYAAPPEGVPLVVAVDDYLGLRAAAAACCTLADGRVLVWGGAFDSPADAYAWASFAIGRREGCRVLIGRTLVEVEAREWLPSATVERVGSGATGVGLPLLRSLARAGRLAHSGDPALATQVTTVGLLPTVTGGLTQAHRGVRADLLHAVAWCVAESSTPVAEPLGFFVY